MARTVSEGMDAFLAQMTPAAGLSQAAVGCSLSIQKCLKANLGITEFFGAGSFANGTSIRYYSNVDYYAVVPAENCMADSANMLWRVRDILERGFPRVGVKVRTSAVIVPFGEGSGQALEVIPARRVGATQDGHSVYKIPDGVSGWTRSSPAADRAYLSMLDDRLEGMVRPLVRLIKAWKFCNRVPISSFYLEMMVAEYASGEDTLSYPIDVRDLLMRLEDSGLSPLLDPRGIAGYISACACDELKEETFAEANTAYTRAERAVTAEWAGRIQEAFIWWNKVFGGQFPDYG